jgi:hypothetical protein
MWGYSVLIILLTTLPYILAFSFEGDAWSFTGFVFGVEDGNSYIAKMLRGYAGDWLFFTPYTTAEQGGVVAFLPYLLLGRLAGGIEIHRQHIILFQAMRVASIPFVVYATYRFISLFIDKIWWRRWATILGTLGGGLGWITLISGQGAVLGSLPLDFISPETFGFLSILGLPHLIITRGLLLLGLVFYLEGREDHRKAWVGGGCLLLLTFIQPLSVLVAYAAFGAHVVAVAIYGLINKQRLKLGSWFRTAIRVSLPSLPVVIYLAFQFSSDPFLKAWTAQNRILSPHIAHYALAYVLVLIPAIFGARVIIQSKKTASLFPLSWVVISLVLAYFPYNLQRRLPEGSWVAWAVLAAVGMMTLFKEERKRRIGGVVLLAFSLISSAVLIIGGVNVARKPSSPIFRPVEEVAAFDWLAQHAENGDHVLASFSTGNVLPAWAPIRVVIGHGPESVDLARLAPQVEAFYAESASTQARQKFLHEHDVRFVFYGPNEKMMSGWNPDESPILVEVYSGWEYQIFEVGVERSQ